MNRPFSIAGILMSAMLFWRCSSEVDPLDGVQVRQALPGTWRCTVTGTMMLDSVVPAAGDRPADTVSFLADTAIALRLTLAVVDDTTLQVAAANADGERIAQGNWYLDIFSAGTSFVARKDGQQLLGYFVGPGRWTGGVYSPGPIGEIDARKE